MYKFFAVRELLVEIIAKLMENVGLQYLRPETNTQPTYKCDILSKLKCQGE
jgi:hypothetical protein